MEYSTSGQAMPAADDNALRQRITEPVSGQVQLERTCVALVYMGLAYRDVAAALQCTEAEVRQYVANSRERAFQMVQESLPAAENNRLRERIAALAGANGDEVLRLVDQLMAQDAEDWTRDSRKWWRIIGRHVAQTRPDAWRDVYVRFGEAL